uniref:Uncharacterized protein n=1 Tax=Arundo donax TaxID=35708 RepID=A0A0A9H5S8_ARUDO
MVLFVGSFFLSDTCMQDRVMRNSGWFQPGLSGLPSRFIVHSRTVDILRRANHDFLLRKY